MNSKTEIYTTYPAARTVIGLWYYNPYFNSWSFILDLRNGEWVVEQGKQITTHRTPLNRLHLSPVKLNVTPGNCNKVIASAWDYFNSKEIYKNTASR